VSQENVDLERQLREAADVFIEAYGRILTLTAFSARGRSSGIEIAQVMARGASLFEIEDGRVTKVILYFNRDRALADLGLEE
jgi:hypothetical protein